jgi:hypothetical protein
LSVGTLIATNASYSEYRVFTTDACGPDLLEIGHGQISGGLLTRIGTYLACFVANTMTRR